MDDEHSSRRRARDRCIAGAVRESVQLEVGVRAAAALLPEAKHQPRPSDPVLAHPRADDREQAAPHTHRAPRAEHGINSQGVATPRRCNLESRRPSARHGTRGSPRQRSRRRRGAHDRFGRDGDLRPARAPATTQTPRALSPRDCSAHEALARRLWWRRAQDHRCSTGRAVAGRSRRVRLRRTPTAVALGALSGGGCAWSGCADES